MKAAQAAIHVVRGGSYSDGATRLRLSMREGLPINTRDVTTGFRIVRFSQIDQLPQRVKFFGLDAQCLTMNTPRFIYDLLFLD